MSKGFTLIEIMVTITIMAVVTFIALPNFRNLGQQQKLANSMNDILGALHAAQANAQSGAICSNGAAANFWAVTLTSTGFATWASCADGTSQPSPLQIKSLASGLSIASPSTPSTPNPADTCYIIFQGNSIAESAGVVLPGGIISGTGCNDNSLKNNGNLTIQVNNGSSCYKNIIIQSGGAIYAGSCP